MKMLVIIHEKVANVFHPFTTDEACFDAVVRDLQKASKVFEGLLDVPELRVIDLLKITPLLMTAGDVADREFDEYVAELRRLGFTVRTKNSTDWERLKQNLGSTTGNWFLR